jgi:hypothetical protein
MTMEIYWIIYVGALSYILFRCLLYGIDALKEIKEQLEILNDRKK